MPSSTRKARTLARDRAPALVGAPSELVAYVVLGAVLGGVYVLFDMLSEARIGRGTLTGALAQAHAIVDHALPLLVGGLLGVAVHYVRLRARLAAAEEAELRAEALRARLSRVERDQAVWVLAAMVLHELKNPLHALGLLLDEIATTSGDDRAGLVDRARAQGDRCLAQLELLRSMRDLGEPDLRRIPLDRAVLGLTEDVGALAREGGFEVRFECAGPIAASGDPAYLRTILENLLDNSLHSLRAKGRGRITVHVGLERGQAVVRVSDDGDPLDPAVRSTLFEPLRTTRTNGLGLGLPIARALARAMRGDLSFEAAPAKTFRLALPLGDAAVATADRTPASAQGDEAFVPGAVASGASRSGS